ncbi:MAG: hypothetical protein ACK53C_04775 [Pseudomonadota bacterium]
MPRSTDGALAPEPAMPGPWLIVPPARPPDQPFASPDTPLARPPMPVGLGPGAAPRPGVPPSCAADAAS